jgi:hypothetical protein
MAKVAQAVDPERVFCEVCARVVPKSKALWAESKDYVAYFCGANCYENWRGERAPAPPPHEVQGGQGRRRSRDERLKRLVRQHPQRDEPRADSVERDELPSR